MMYEYRAHIRSVYDGDTIRADIDCGFGIWTANQPLRLLGIDAPEMGTEEGRASRDYLRALLPVGQEVIIQTHKDQDDKYGRLLATIVRVIGADLDVVTINGRMINAGHARPYDGGKR